MVVFGGAVRILVTSDGMNTLERAAEYTTYLADPAVTEIRLLGFCRAEEATVEERRALQTLCDDLVEALECPLDASLRCGDPAEEILAETARYSYDLVVLGIHLRRRLTHLRPKVVARQLATRIAAPLLVVFPEWGRLRRMLICTSAAREDMPVVRTGGRLAHLADAAVTVLHVMSQIPITADADMADLQRSAEELMEHDAREGLHFEKALDVLEEVGVPPDRAEAKIRHGLVVDQIVRESEEGNFDLIAIGAHHVSSDRSWHELRELIQEDIAERVLSEARRPVLIVPSASVQPVDAPLPDLGQW